MKKEQTTELTVIENPKLTELAQKSGIELTKAEAHVSAFHPALAELSELSRPLASLDKENPTDEHAKTARENRLKIVKVRTGSESIKDERKKVLLAESNLIQSAFNLVKDACILTESEYEEIEKHQERIEAQKRAQLKDARIALLLPFETDTTYLPLDIMSDDQFNALFAKEKEAFEAVAAKRLKDELDRIEAERVAEEKRLAEIEAEKERIRLQAIENEKLQAELAAQRKEAERLQAIAEAERVEAQKRLDEAKKEADRIAAEKQKEVDELKAKQAAIELAEENERLAKIAEQKEKEAATKAALLAPDKEKVRIFYDQFIALKFPELSSEPGIKMSARVAEALEVVKQLIIQDSKNLI